MHALSVSHVTKRYGALTAVNDVSLHIEPGEIFALLGPNGAGKTTLIGCITGLTVGFEGQITVAGYDVTAQPQVTRQLVGLVPQEVNYDAFFNARDVLRNQGGYFGVRDAARRADELLEAFGLADKAEANTRWLSGGMKRRLMICKALMHDPVLLFLDEPTAGVDVELREELWRYVRKLRERGTTIVLTTHYIEEAEQLADRVGVLHKGVLRRVDERDALMAELGQRVVEVRLAQPVPADLPGALPQLALSQSDAHTLVLQFSDASPGAPSPTDALLRELVARELHVADIAARQSSLEEIFRQLIQDAA